MYTFYCLNMIAFHYYQSKAMFICACRDVVLLTHKKEIINRSVLKNCG